VVVEGEEEVEEEVEGQAEEEEEEEEQDHHHHPERSRPEYPIPTTAPPIQLHLRAPRGPRAPEPAACLSPAVVVTWWCATATRMPCCSPCAKTDPTRDASSTSATAGTATSSSGQISQANRGRRRSSSSSSRHNSEPCSHPGLRWALGTSPLWAAEGKVPLRRPCATATRRR